MLYVFLAVRCAARLQRQADLSRHPIVATTRKTRPSVPRNLAITSSSPLRRVSPSQATPTEQRVRLLPRRAALNPALTSLPPYIAGTPLAHVFVATLPCPSSATLASLHSDASQLPTSSWTCATLETGEASPRADGKSFAWTLWKVDLEVVDLAEGEEKEVALVAFCGESTGAGIASGEGLVLNHTCFTQRM